MCLLLGTVPTYFITPATYQGTSFFLEQQGKFLEGKEKKTPTLGLKSRPLASGGIIMSIVVRVIDDDDDDDAADDDADDNNGEYLGLIIWGSPAKKLAAWLPAELAEAELS